jgi:regulator of sigma E protease
MHYIHVVIEFAIVLGIMVLIHELGHFAVAKWCGVRVETFSIGMGPRLFGFRSGDTDYRISLLPLGGYVKMAGDAPGEAPTGDPGEFNAHPRWQRSAIAFAGPIANFILSFFLLLFVGLYHNEIEHYLDGPAVVDYVPLNTPAANDGLAPGDTIVSFNNKLNPTWEQIFQECALNLGRTLPMTFLHNGQTVTRDLVIPSGDGKKVGVDTLATIGLMPREQAGPIDIASIAPGTPADRAGLKAGDQIVRIDSVTLHSVTPLHSYLNDRSGAPSVLSVLRNGQPMSITLTPERVDDAPSFARYQIGFLPQPIPVDVVRLPLGQAITQSLKDNRDDSTLILRVLKGLFTRHVSVKALSGPVGIAQQIDVAAQDGIWTLVRFMSSISLNLGIFNLLPIPILDGGMILFLFIESIMRRDFNQKVKEGVYQVAFVCLIMFFAFVLYNDITRH